MKFTYKGVLDVATVHGLTFKKGEAVEVKDSKIIKKLEGNSQFDSAEKRAGKNTQGKSAQGKNAQGKN
ncbi:MAG: hypothetical protein GWN13_21120 [Phycisphaerae bacterium]|nr:hypothetical protein [Phycisphaerae bacterium]